MPCHARVRRRVTCIIRCSSYSAVRNTVSPISDVRRTFRRMVDFRGRRWKIFLLYEYCRNRLPNLCYVVKRLRVLPCSDCSRLILLNWSRLFLQRQLTRQEMEYVWSSDNNDEGFNIGYAAVANHLPSLASRTKRMQYHV